MDLREVHFLAVFVGRGGEGCDFGEACEGGFEEGAGRVGFGDEDADDEEWEAGGTAGDGVGFADD